MGNGEKMKKKGVGEMNKYLLGWYRKDLVESEVTTKVSLFQLIADWWKNNRCIKSSKIIESWMWHETELELTEEEALYISNEYCRMYLPIMKAGGGKIDSISLIRRGYTSVFVSDKPLSAEEIEKM